MFELLLSPLQTFLAINICQHIQREGDIESEAELPTVLCLFGKLSGLPLSTRCRLIQCAVPSPLTLTMLLTVPQNPPIPCLGV